METSRFLTGLAVTFGVDLAAFLATWALARRLGRWNVVDVTWGASFVLVAAVSFAWSVGHGGALDRRIVVMTLTAMWGSRLALYISLRGRGHGEDPRYAALFERRPRGRSPSAHALRVVFGPQAVLSWLVPYRSRSPCTNGRTWGF